MYRIPDFFRGMIIGFCAGIIVIGLAWGFVARRNTEKEKLEYAAREVEKQIELQDLREDIANRTIDELLSDPAVRGAVDGATGDFERQRDELLQRFRGGITD